MKLTARAGRAAWTGCWWSRRTTTASQSRPLRALPRGGRGRRRPARHCSTTFPSAPASYRRATTACAWPRRAGHRGAQGRRRRPGRHGAPGGRRPCGFEIYSGDDVMTLPLLAVGAVGAISVASHWVGPQLGQVIEAVPRRATWPGRSPATPSCSTPSTSSRARSTRTRCRPRRSAGPWACVGQCRAHGRVDRRNSTEAPRLGSASPSATGQPVA